MSQQYGSHKYIGQNISNRKVPQKSKKKQISSSDDEDKKAIYMTQTSPFIKKIQQFHRYHEPPQKLKKATSDEHNAKLESLDALKKKTLQYNSMAEMIEDNR